MNARKNLEIDPRTKHGSTNQAPALSGLQLLERHARVRIHGQPQALRHVLLGAELLDDLTPLLGVAVPDPRIVKAVPHFKSEQLDEMKLELRIFSRRMLRLVREDPGKLLATQALSALPQLKSAVQECAKRTEKGLDHHFSASTLPIPWNAFLRVCHLLVVQKHSEALHLRVVREIHRCVQDVARNTSRVQHDELARVQVVYTHFRPNFDATIEDWVRAVDKELEKVTDLVSTIATTDAHLKDRQV